MKKNIYFFIVLFIVTMFLLSSLSLADDSNNNTSEEEVVVTATRTAEPESQAPGKTEVITKEEIGASGATTVAEALADFGIANSSYGGKFGAATIQLDGSNAKQTLVLVNGVPINTGPDGSADLSYISTAAIERIEVSHGPLSALYGSSGIGGVVNIITNLTGQSLNEANVSGGTFNTKGLDLKCQQENWGLAVGGDMTDGYRIHSETYSNYLMGQYNFFQTGDEYLKLYWQALSKHGEQPGSLTYPSTTATEADQDLAINLNGLSNLWGGAWEYKIYGQHYDLKYDDPDPSWPSHSRHQVSSYGIDTAGQYQLGNHELLAGVMLKQESSESTDFGNHSRNDDALFLQDSWKLAGRLKMITGLRQDYYSDFSSPLLPKVTFVQSITDQFTVKAGYGKIFRAPSFEDLYWFDSVNLMYGDPNLKPETGERTDLIAEWRQSHQSVTLDIYQSNLQNGIVWVYDDATWVSTVTNFDKVHVNGASLNWENIWAKVITTRIGYSYTDKKANDSVLGDDQEYNYYGKNQFNLGLDFNYQAWRYGMNWYLVKDRDCFASHLKKQLPDYNVINLNVRYLMNKNLSFTFAVDNSTDEDYQVESGYPMPGRTYNLSAKYTF